MHPHAVTFGPALLIWEDRGAWRNKVVKVALIHWGLSLLAFVGAFACAGFVTALVSPPPASCALVQCSQGGVPCSKIPTRTLNGGTAWHLDPQLTALNRATFNPLGSADAPHVSCTNYAAVSGSPLKQSLDFLQVPQVYSPSKTPPVFDAKLVQPGDPAPCKVAPCFPQGSCLFLIPKVYYDDLVYLDDYGPATWCSVFSRQQARQMGASLELNGYQVHNVMKLLSYETEWLNKKYSNNSMFRNIFSEVEEVFQEWFSLESADNVTQEQVLSGDDVCFSQRDWDDMPGVSQLLRPHYLPKQPESEFFHNRPDTQAILHREGTFNPGS